MTLSFTPDELLTEWQLLDTVRERSTVTATQTARVAHGTARMALG